jgi:hypothetical protein
LKPIVLKLSVRHFINKSNGQRHCCSFFCAHGHQTTVNERSHGAEYIHVLVEALSGNKVEDLYSDPSSNSWAFTKQATHMLYGVLGGVTDTRDWNKIMSSPDIASTASDQTAELHEPYIDIQSKYERVELTDGTVTEILTTQFPVLKNKNDDILSTNLTTTLSNTIGELSRFGGKQIIFDKSILDKITIQTFDFDSLQVIQNYLDKTAV